jgi:hypothetical protein
MHIYAFGSICRGDITFGSDIDVLAITTGLDSRFDPDVYSVYSYERIEQLWKQGNPFAWHLHLESRLLYTSDAIDFLISIGEPAAYTGRRRDCQKFKHLLETAIASLESGSKAPWFELSTAFLATRNFATCYSLHQNGKPDFSRNAAIRLGNESVPISTEAYDVLQRARILTTRGTGASLSDTDLKAGARELRTIDGWMEGLLAKVAV